MMSLNYWMVFIRVRYSRLYREHHKKQGELPTNALIHICINRINNKPVFKIKDGYKLELQTPET